MWGKDGWNKGKFCRFEDRRNWKLLEQSEGLRNEQVSMVMIESDAMNLFPSQDTDLLLGNIGIDILESHCNYGSKKNQSEGCRLIA